MHKYVTQLECPALPNGLVLGRLAASSTAGVGLGSALALTWGAAREPPMPWMLFNHVLCNMLRWHHLLV
jgi:hypothetical protein